MTIHNLNDLQLLSRTTVLPEMLLTVSVFLLRKDRDDLIRVGTASKTDSTSTRRFRSSKREARSNNFGSSSFIKTWADLLSDVFELHAKIVLTFSYNNFGDFRPWGVPMKTTPTSRLSNDAYFGCWKFAIHRALNSLEAQSSIPMSCAYLFQYKPP